MEIENLFHRTPRNKTRLLGLKKKSWLSILIIVLVCSMLVTVCYILGQYNKILKGFAMEPKSVFAYHIPPQPKTKRDIVLTAKHSDILLRIWNNESSQGRNNTSDPTALHQYCKNQGLTNEWGFNPQSKYCFKTFSESVAIVDKWFDRCLANNTLSECLSLYSGGSKNYVASFLNQ